MTGFQVRGLSEIAIQTRNMPAMLAFYRDDLGLEPFGSRAGGAIEFLKVADGFAGLTTVVALFDADRSIELVSGRATATGQGSSLHHIALSVSRHDQDRAQTWFAERGIASRIEEFSWVGWRGLFVRDPDGNTVELVAHDSSVYVKGS